MWGPSMSSRQDRYGLIIDRLPVPIAYLDDTLHYRMSNKAHQDWWSMKEPDIVGKHISEILGPKNFSGIEAELHAALAGKKISFEFQVSLPMKGLRDAFINYLPDADDSGQVVGITIIVNDITEKKVAERDNTSLLQRYESLYNNTPIMLHSIDRDRKLVSVSNYWLEVLGYTREEVLGKESWRFLTPESAAYAKEVVLPAFYRDGYCNNIAYKFVKKNGEIIDTLVSATADLDEHGEIIRSLAVVLNVTDQKRAEQERDELEQQLRHSQKMEALGTLAGGIAHDFNNILGGIIGYTELAMAASEPQNSVQEFLKNVHTSGFRARDLVHQILTFSQKRPPEFSSVDIVKLIDEVCALLKTSFPPHLHFHVDVDSAARFARGNESQLHQVLLNLCTNAKDALRGMTEGSLFLEVRDFIQEGFDPKQVAPGHYIQIVVRDTGHGMSSEVQKRIFEPYFTTKHRTQGSGLGLSVVHGIVASHGGHIQVTSDIGAGSTFEVFIPVAERPPEVAQESTIIKRDHAAAKILFIDDEPVLAQLGYDMLTMLGYQTIACVSPLEALRIFEEERDIALIITDETMPIMPGHELVKRLRATGRPVPIILCTGFSADIAGKTPEDLGVHSILMKPVSIQNLGNQITRALIDGPAIRTGSMNQHPNDIERHRQPDAQPQALREPPRNSLCQDYQPGPIPRGRSSKGPPTSQTH